LGLAAVFRAEASDVLAEKLRELILSRALAEGTPLPTERSSSRSPASAAHRYVKRCVSWKPRGWSPPKPAATVARSVRRPGRESISVRSRCSCAVMACGSKLCSRRARRSSPPRHRLAAIHRTDDDLAEMTRIHRQLAGVSDDVDEHVRLNLQWHRAVCGRAATNC